ncbi:MAG TPA: 6-phosphofructokinase [Thermoanaerobaculia bacterium]|nr:6-phosphofructokinase [Thermoanaerobaculia bacterium]
MSRKRIGVLTGGGDVPGLNSAIKSVVWNLADDFEILGLRRGWSALLHLQPENAANHDRWVVPLERANTRTIDRTGGTILHSSRANPAIVPVDRIPGHLEGSGDGRSSHVDLTADAIRSIEHLRLEGIVAIGGDGTLQFAARLHREGVPVVAIPKTMDNDVNGTDYCIGFSTAITRSVHLINDLRTAAGSNERILVVELFGRYSGETCLLTSYVSGVDRAVIAEVEFDPERLLAYLLADKAENPRNYAVVAISEGARPVGGAMVETGEPDDVGRAKLGGIGGVVRDFIERNSRERVIYQQLGYLMRSGSPDSLDQIVANTFGTVAANLVRRGESGSMVAVRDGKYAAVPVELVTRGQKRVDVDKFYNPVQYRPRVTDPEGLPMFLY